MELTLGVAYKAVTIISSNGVEYNFSVVSEYNGKIEASDDKQMRQTNFIR